MHVWISGGRIRGIDAPHIERCVAGELLEAQGHNRLDVADRRSTMADFSDLCLSIWMSLNCPSQSTNRRNTHKTWWGWRDSNPHGLAAGGF